MPFGEVFIEERNNTWNTPYLFNAKELDEETGLYYYGARYYDPRSSIWISVDPPLVNGYYLDGHHDGGIYNSYNINPYLYCRANPILFRDPDGNQVNIVTYGIKNRADDDFVKRCATASAKAIGVSAQGVGTGNDVVSVLSGSSKVATWVNWGHSSTSGLYLQDDKGFYVGSMTIDSESSNISKMSKSGFSTTKSSLFIFASCLTKYNSRSFGYQFAEDAVVKGSELGVGTHIYKVTTIGATNYSNLKLDGTVKTDGEFI